MEFIYNLGILVYSALIWILSPFNSKAGLWIIGRKGWYKELKRKIIPGERYIWMHCASLGEFEQGRPVIEAIKKEMPGIRIVLTFFSPSGYEIRKNYDQADIVCYLPADTPKNAVKFIDLINPEKVIFVKYEFWYNYIKTIEKRRIPLFLISAIFRKEQFLFKWYGSFFGNILKGFTEFYVQDQLSADILKEEGVEKVTVAGDTRFDRVIQIADNAGNIPVLEKFRDGGKIFLAGSSWKKDEEIIASYINKHPESMKWVFAPHEIDNDNIERLERLFTTSCVRFSRINDDLSGARVMIIDNIGMLSSAYHYAYIAAVGGGFGKGIHNILEPACWGVPVLFGPNHKQFREALELISLGGGRSFKNYEEFETILNEWLDNEDLYRKAADSAGKYVRENTGATRKIIEGIKS
ncbi:MAG: 3-deoxy-D-manno-octulosonic acid transferase [Bacteroidales bacterium]|nr:3-deoxy-D-manno-octulosonic acid transferase [Bacteroidales bacterium]